MNRDVLVYPHPALKQVAREVHEVQLFQQLPMDPIEPAVAEDRHDIVFPQERHQLLYNMSRVRFVERRPA